MDINSNNQTNSVAKNTTCAVWCDCVCEAWIHHLPEPTSNRNEYNLIFLQQPPCTILLKYLYKFSCYKLYTNSKIPALQDFFVNLSCHTRPGVKCPCLCRPAVWVSEKTVDISLIAYLGSYEASGKVVKTVLGENYTLDEDFVEALNLWCEDSGCEQVPVNGCKQSVWDSPMVARIHNSLISDSRDLVNQTRLVAVSTREPGAWLNALPINLHSDETARNTLSLILGVRGTIGTPWSLLLPPVIRYSGYFLECAQLLRSEQSSPIRWPP
ncbi:hypothetical protein ACOME3_009520 [Neoechinorhynchus agilis]